MGGPRRRGKGALTRVGKESRGKKGHVGRSVLGWPEALAAKARVHMHVHTCAPQAAFPAQNLPEGLEGCSQGPLTGTGPLAAASKVSSGTSPSIPGAGDAHIGLRGQEEGPASWRGQQGSPTPPQAKGWARGPESYLPVRGRAFMAHFPARIHPLK